jgi:hypothetical protein
MTETAHKKETLWLLAFAPAIWAIHFLLSYATASVWCAKISGRDNPIDGALLAIFVYTVVALGGIAIVGWAGYRRHRHGNGKLPHDDDTPEDRTRFLGFATLLLSGLSALATTFSAFVLFFFRRC